MLMDMNLQVSDNFFHAVDLIILYLLLMMPGVYVFISFDNILLMNDHDWS